MSFLRVPRYLIIFSFCISHFQGFSQNRDSLLNALLLKKDTSSVTILLELARSFKADDPKIELKYALDARKTAFELKSNLKLIQATNYLGLINQRNSEQDSAIALFDKSLELLKVTPNSTEAIKTYLYKGTSLYSKSNYKDALQSYLNGLKFSVAKNTQDAANLLNNIGNVYLKLENDSMALYYHHQALAIRKSLGEKKSIAKSLNNLGIIYKNSGEHQKALDAYHQSLKIKEEDNDLKSIALCLNNIGEVYSDMEDYNEALKYHIRALKLNEELKDSFAIGYSYNNIGVDHIKLNNLDLAEKFQTMALNLSEITMDVETRMEAYHGLSVLNHERRDFEKAFGYFEKYINLRDSIFNQQNKQQIAELQAIYESEKKDKEIMSLNKNNIIRKTELRQQQQFTYFMTVGMLLITALSFISYAAYKQKKNANRELQYRSDKLEEANNIIKLNRDEIQQQNKDITDSIKYARRIQEAILPPDALIKKLFPESFVLYKPKDIVCGDFYWFEEKNDMLLFAAVDCTGHGVPGAFMSLVGFNMLNQAVNERNIIKPSEILNELNKGVSATLHQTYEESSVRDGMDIALCSINTRTGIMNFAGAINPVWIIRDKEIIEIKGDKFSIGIFIGEELKSFTNHEFQLKPNDQVYVFSDGYEDQFGGEKNKKLTRKRMKELFLDNCSKSMQEQHATFATNIIGWQGDNEQIDDILVIGIKIS